MRRAVNRPMWLSDLWKGPGRTCHRTVVEDWRGRADVFVSLHPAPSIVCASCDSRPTHRLCLHACWLLLRIGGQLDTAVFQLEDRGRCLPAVHATYANLHAVATWHAALRARGDCSQYEVGRLPARVSVARVGDGGELVDSVVDLFGPHPEPVRWTPGDATEACPICLEPFGTADSTACSGCRNGFHTACVGRWGRSCPTCRDPDQFAALIGDLDADLIEFVDEFRCLLARGSSVPSAEAALGEIVAWL